MLMNPVRRVVGRLGERLTGWSRGEDWVLETLPSGFTLRRRRPCLFDDVDTFAKFLLAIQNQGALHIQTVGSTSLWSVSDSEVAARVANLNLRDRLNIAISGTRTDFHWHLTLNRHGPRLGMSPMTQQNIDFAREITNQVDRFARPVRRMAADEPVVQPISMISALQHAHDRKMSRRSIIWGLIGGAVAGPIVTALMSLLVATHTH